MTRPSSTGAAETAQGRFHVLEAALRRSNMIAMAMGFAAAISVVTATTVILMKPAPVYFATDSEGRLTPLVPVSEPFLTDNQVTNFAVEAITRSMTFTFATWRDDFAEAREYFEQPDGWDEFVRAIEASQMLDYIESRRMNATSVANGVVIVREGLDPQGRYSWVLQVPITVVYESASETSRDNLIAEITVARLPTWDTPRGVGVSRIIMRPGTL